MIHREPTRRPEAPDPNALRRALAEARRVVERALAERDQALHERDRALRQRDDALQERDRAIEVGRARAEVLHLDDATRTDPRVSRLMADLANVRRVRDEQIERARNEERAARLLELAAVQDGLQRSLDANPDHHSPWYLGHVAILANVKSAFRTAGATELGRVGEAFDPALHQAVGRAEGPEGQVVAVERAGWQLDDGTLVRPAEVWVAG